MDSWAPPCASAVAVASRSWETGLGQLANSWSPKSELVRKSYFLYFRTHLDVFNMLQKLLQDALRCLKACEKRCEELRRCPSSLPLPDDGPSLRTTDDRRSSEKFGESQAAKPSGVGPGHSMWVTRSRWRRAPEAKSKTAEDRKA